MELSALTALVKVVQTGSFTKAAEALQTQKAHLSRVISQLEQSLGARLLERTTRSLSLTEVGREFYERAIGILAAVADAELMVQRARGSASGLLRITCGAEFGMIAVSGWVSSFLARYPEVHVELDYTGRIVDIVHEGFDLAIRVGPLPDSSLSARKLGELRYALFASPSYLARHPAPQTVAALREHALLMFTTGTQRSEWKLQCGDAEVRIDGPSRLRVNNGFTLREACLRGLGIARLPWLLAADAHARGELLVLLPEWQLPSVPIHAVYASARYLAPKVRAFIDHAVAEFAQRETGH